ncbi:Hypothetical protein Minf_0199 [Methylacidiphilum infernorum V4]|uniref:Uncharacterized protein n=1 Tax=Methylacidiphilum infernorum (isolate V4) TaxID=481448 RepID=B3DXM5_METI4|nr:Hypothetical protein Minf_0199 [Methylacidiphilum infernorum V4]
MIPRSLFPMACLASFAKIFLCVNKKILEDEVAL